MPILFDDNGDLTIIDPVKSLHFSPKVIFTLEEENLVESLKNNGFNAKTIPSGRQQSSEVIRQTYVGVTEACLK